MPVIRKAPLVIQMTGGAPASNPAHIPAPAPGSMEWRADYELYYHYGGYQQIPVHGATYRLTAIDGEVRTGTLDNNGRAQEGQLAVGPVTVEYQYDQVEDDTDELIETRKKFKKLLDQLIVETRQQYAAQWEEWNNSSEIEQLAENAYGRGAGFLKGLSSIEDSVMYANPVTAQPLYLRKVVLDYLFEDGNKINEDFESIKKLMNLDIAKMASDVQEVIGLIYADPLIRQYLWDTATQWWDALPPPEQHKLRSQFSTEITFGILIGIIAGASSGGTGLLLSAGSLAAKFLARLGQPVIEVIKKLEPIIKKLGELLKKIKRKADDTPKPEPLDPKTQTRELETVRLLPRSLKPYWPPKRGFFGLPKTIKLKKGAKLSRFGGFIDKATGKFKDFGTFVAPDDVPYPMRALPPGSDKRPYTVYEVLKEIEEVPSGPASPWFGEPGMGMQYELPLPIEDLVKQGYLRVISRNL